MWSRRTMIGMMMAAAGSGALIRLPGGAYAQGSTAPEGDWLSRFRTPDGRLLEFFEAGPVDGLPLVCHHGTPYSALGFKNWTNAAQAAGMRVIAYSRPGYGVSTRLFGRNVAQAADDTASLLDYLGAEAFVTAGWSGGGPHALACGALLSNRCKGVATLAGVGPWGQSDLDFLNGMARENVSEFGAAIEGVNTLTAFLTDNYADFDEVTGEQVAESLGGLVSEPDKAALSDTFADSVAAAFRWSLHSGFGGWIDDDVAFTKPWGFSLDNISVPVTVWQGQQDNMVPAAHGKWLATHIRGAELRYEPEQGHISLVTTYLPNILESLAADYGTVH